MRSLIVRVENLERYVKKMIHSSEQENQVLQEWIQQERWIDQRWHYFFQVFFKTFAESERMNLH